MLTWKLYPAEYISPFMGFDDRYCTGSISWKLNITICKKDLSLSACKLY
jgi:hypothetical protein